VDVDFNLVHDARDRVRQSETQFDYVWQQPQLAHSHIIPPSGSRSELVLPPKAVRGGEDSKFSNVITQSGRQVMIQLDTEHQGSELQRS
jgi:hypothetical protein